MTYTPRKDGPRSEAERLARTVMQYARVSGSAQRDLTEYFIGYLRQIRAEAAAGPRDYSLAPAQPLEPRTAADDEAERLDKAEAVAGPKPAPSTTPQARDDGLRLVRVRPGEHGWHEEADCDGGWTEHVHWRSQRVIVYADMPLRALDGGTITGADVEYVRRIEALTPADNDGALPSRVVVGKNGAYWRDYGTHYSMCPVSTDNDPVEPVAIYVRAKWSEAIRAEEAAALAATTGTAPESEEPVKLDLPPSDDWRENELPGSY